MIYACILLLFHVTKTHGNTHRKIITDNVLFTEAGKAHTFRSTLHTYTPQYIFIRHTLFFQPPSARPLLNLFCDTLAPLPAHVHQRQNVNEGVRWPPRGGAPEDAEQMAPRGAPIKCFWCPFNWRSKDGHLVDGFRSVTWIMGVYSDF